MLGEKEERGGRNREPPSGQRPPAVWTLHSQPCPLQSALCQVTELGVESHVLSIPSLCAEGLLLVSPQVS